MKYFAVFLLVVFVGLPAFAGAAAETNAPSLFSPSASTGGLTTCPRKGADALIAVERQAAANNPNADRIFKLCVAEYVKYLEARMKALEAAKAK